MDTLSRMEKNIFFTCARKQRVLHFYVQCIETKFMSIRTLNVSWILHLFLPLDVMSWFVLCDCSISRSYLLGFIVVSGTKMVQDEVSPKNI